MTRWSDQESAGSGVFLLGALAGALVGAGVALLLAPKTGAQVRNEISSGLNTARDVASRRYRELADKATQKIDQATQKIDQAAQKLGYESKTASADRFNGGTTASVSDPYTTNNPGTGY